MIKSIWTVKRASGVSHAEIADFWDVAQIVHKGWRELHDVGVAVDPDA